MDTTWLVLLIIAGVLLGGVWNGPGWAQQPPPAKKLIEYGWDVPFPDHFKNAGVARRSGPSAVPKARQQLSERTRSCISSSLGWVYTTVVNGLTCRANRCARNRSWVARYTAVMAE